MIRSRARLTAYAIALALVAAVAHAAPPADPADAAFARQAWAEAARGYEARVAVDPADGHAWFRLGSARYQLTWHQAAIDAYTKADALGVYPMIARYNAACSAALLGETDLAFTWLDKAVDTAAFGPDKLTADDDLASLRADPRWAKLIDRADRKTRPCRYDETRQALDFWVGEWDVSLPEGVVVGQNTVRRVMEGCALTEHWQGRLGTSGHSTTYLDPVSKRWKQVYVDTKGTVFDFVGQAKGDAVVFEGTQAPFTGADVARVRMTYRPLPDGAVQQLIERRVDGKDQWQTVFDGRYVRRGGDAPTAGIKPTKDTAKE